MINLLKKEIKLAMHPTAIMFLLLSAMLLIPNYPYYVVFFYTGLAIFFTCMNGRENNDVFFTMLLPVAKKDVVKSRFTFAIILELLQVIIAIPFAILRQKMPMGGNEAGMDANITLFALSFVMLGIFNIVFFTIYYKNVMKVGKAFVASSVAVFLYIGVAETCCFAIPFVRDNLDTNDTVFVKYKMILLVIGIVVYSILTFIAYKKSCKLFEKLDI